MRASLLLRLAELGDWAQLTGASFVCNCPTHGEHVTHSVIKRHSAV